jgi:type IV pilus assembly protein PilB
MVKFDDQAFQSQLETVHRAEEEDLVKALADQYGIEYVNLRGYTINPDAINTLSRNEAEDSQVIPFDKTFQSLSVAIRNPNNPKTQDTLTKLEKLELEIKLYLCSSSSITHGLERYDDQTQTTATKKGVLDINPETIERNAKNIERIEDVAAGIEKIRAANHTRRISETIELMFAGALALGASDIHIEPEEEVIRMRYRLDGVLQDVLDLERFIYERTMSRLKLLSGMILNQRQEAQDGRFTFTTGEREIEIRSSIIPGASGETIVMRLLDPSVAAFTLEKIGLNEQMYEILQQQLKRPNGLMITTGPTGSGKTTALYALLRKAHTPERKIITIENPVEYKIDGIVQTQVGDDYTFANGLRSILRQDPDIIMVGEIRDNDVASVAIHAAQTGHLVFSTLHTNHAAGAFPRLIDIGVDPRMIGSSINVVLAQRLVRVLCDKCKKKRSVSDEERDLLHTILATHPGRPDVPNPIKVYDAVGCEACNHSGFQGRAAVFEAILVDEAVEEVVIQDPREHLILEAAIPQGIPTMPEDGIMKVIHGVTSLPELRRVVDLTTGRHAIPHEKEKEAKNTSPQTTTKPSPETPETDTKEPKKNPEDELFEAHIMTD